ncbi:hypothetical protein I6A84_17280, partial [Frankia sp. CNm7]|nr:hypothetical protein [Frankia nepalensis]
GSQEKAAEVLGLPFSTYRRHLATGVGGARGGRGGGGGGPSAMPPRAA